MREIIARRAAALLHEGWTVNLGIGIPTLIAKYLDPDRIFLHSENGILGVGPPPGPGELDVDLIDANKRPITQRPGVSFFDSAESFAMLRGGHLDAAVLGALQVDEHGLLANWAVPGEPVLGAGGAMDICVGVRTLIVAMSHTTNEGAPKLVARCTLPITSTRSADWIVTELGTFRCEAGALALVELAPGASLGDVRARTAAAFEVRLPT